MHCINLYAVAVMKRRLCQCIKLQSLACTTVIRVSEVYISEQLKKSITGSDAKKKSTNMFRLGVINYLLHK